MRLPPIAVLLVLAASWLNGCQSAATHDLRATPVVPVVVAWPAGTSFVATVARNLPDLPKWRAVPVWWQEALRQTQRFALTSEAVLDTANLPKLELTVNDQTRTVLATLHTLTERLPLAKCSYAKGSEIPNLPEAIDYVAWCTRLALGEAAPPPQAISKITSPDAQVAVAVQDAVLLMHGGGFVSAHRALRSARQRDGGSPFVLDRIAELELLRGNAEVAERICIEALGYEHRVSPTVQHRLARTLLMARAARGPARAAEFDQQLATLAAVARRERPHDEEPVWTAALANNFLSEFAAARPLLEKLLLRQPENAFVPYHLGWACLGMDDAAAAVLNLEKAAARLPAPWVLLPQAIALYEANQHAALATLLQEVLVDYGRSEDSLTHQVLRMQAAHAILQNQPDVARSLLFADLQWLQNHPTALDKRAGEFAETGALLVRLGSDANLPLLLAAVQRLHPTSIVADAAAFVSGMHQMQTTGLRATKLEQQLGRDGDSAWSALLAAFAHERLGEVGEMQQELAIAARLSDSPMTKALLAKSLRSVGKVQEAEQLHQTLRRELVQIQLRRSCQHPLFGPELAYAFVVR